MNDRALRDIVIGLGGAHRGRAARDRLRHHGGVRGDGDPLPRRGPRRPQGARLGRILVGSRPRRHAGDRRRPQGRRRDGGAAQRRDEAEPGADPRGRAGARPRRAVRQHRPRLQLGRSPPSWRSPSPTAWSPRPASASTSAPRSSSTSSAATAGLAPAAVVLVATVRALKMHGGVAAGRSSASPTRRRVERGLANLEKHVENIRLFGEPPVVALNRFPTDTDEELARRRARAASARRAVRGVADVFGDGGAGGARRWPRRSSAQAEHRRRASRRSTTGAQPIQEKIDTIAHADVRRRGRSPTRKRAKRDSPRSRSSATAACRSASPRPSTRSPTTRRCSAGREDFDVTVREVILAAGAGSSCRCPATSCGCRACPAPAGRAHGSRGRGTVVYAPGSPASTTLPPA